MTRTELAWCIAVPVVTGLLAVVVAFAEALAADNRNQTRHAKESAR